MEDKIAQLMSMPEVDAAEPDYRVQLYDTEPNDASYFSQWHLPSISAPAAWDTSVGKKNVKVCIIDSGVRVDHPDLASNIIMGWNFVPLVQDRSLPSPGPGDADFTKFNDTLGHGTHVAGIIGAVGNNSIGVSGVAWKVGIMACKFVWDDGAGYISDAIKCMQLCLRMAPTCIATVGAV